MAAHELLVATDFSPVSEAAVRVARDYAERLGARVHLLHVTWAGEYDVADLLARTAEELGPHLSVTVAGRSGEPAEEIARYAREHGIDLIVVGTHGRTGVSRAILGSVAERLLRLAPCPVVAVPTTEIPAAPPPSTVREAEALPGQAAARGCLVCATPSPYLICDPCRARIRGEAILRKQQEERAGRS